jgi:DNA repair exonuclease SbcCD ATPase subunit
MDYVEKIRNTVENPSPKSQMHSEYIAFYQSVIGLGVEDLRKNLLLYQNHLQETNHAMKTNPHIAEASQKVQKLEKPYRDAINESKDKIKQLKRFVDDSVCVDDLRKEIIKYTHNAENEKIKMSRDPEINDAKTELRNLKGPFNDAKKVLEVKISYIHILIEGLY